MSTDGAIKLEEATRMGDKGPSAIGEVAGRSAGTPADPAKGATGSKAKSSVPGIKRRVSHADRTRDQPRPLEEPQSPLPIGRSGEAVREIVAAEPASLSAAVATPPFSSTEGFTLKQKLAEVRRRISYIQKRGHNERFNYSYVTAADIAGAVGDALAELEVVVIPNLESISHENISPNQGYSDRLTRVVMTYTFMDVNSAEELTVKMPGEGRDPGDKGPYKAMTGALKYALLQSFLLATGDDPEDERPDARLTATNSEHMISGDEVRELQSLIDETGTELERVLAYYKHTSLGELTETAYRRAVEILKRKLAKRSEQGAVHAAI